MPRSCPKGYVDLTGTFQGMSLGEMEKNISTISMCAELCDEDPNCKSFEYNKKAAQCKLNHNPNPTQKEPYPDFVFCQRESEYLKTQ